MKLPPLSDVPACIDRRDLHSGLEAMLADLRCDPPDSLLDELEETTVEVERLLVEVEDRA
jgi:hypothetical protein